MTPTMLIFYILSLAVGAAIGIYSQRARLRSSQRDRESIIAKASAQAEEITSGARFEAQRLLEEARITNRRENAESLSHLEERQDSILARVAAREDDLRQAQERLAKLANTLHDELASLSQQRENLAQMQISADRQQREAAAALEKVSSLSAEAARTLILEQAAVQVEEQRGRLLRQMNERLQAEASDKALSILIDAMQRQVGSCTYERTAASVHIPSEEIKGRIIGRDGRNIRTIETLTGANILIDDTPEVVTVSCFDPIRREVARQLLVRLVEDGRIHPNTIQEFHAQVRENLDLNLQESARNLALELGVGALPEALLAPLSRLQFMNVGGQNLQRLSREVASIAGIIAAELGLDVASARRAGLLHAIGHALPAAEGQAAQAAADLLRAQGEDDDIVQAIAAQGKVLGNHAPLSRIIHIAIQLATGRPGARDESTQIQVTRLARMENLVAAIAGVHECTVLQAGREILVSVDPGLVSDARTEILAADIAARLEQEFPLPGPVQIIVERATRATVSTQAQESGFLA